MLTRPLTRPLVRPLTRRVTEPAFGGWSPRVLFAAGEQGAWYDPSDLSSLSQDSAGTTPVTAVGQPVGLMLDKSGRGNHASQPTATARPTLQADATGRKYLEFDGVDDFLVTPAIDFTATDKMTVVAGARKESDAATSVLLELSASTTVNAGTFHIAAPASGGTYKFQGVSRGGASEVYARSTDVAHSAPITAILALSAAIADDSLALRVNGKGVVSNNDQGTGNFGEHPLYIGSRGGTSLPFTGRIYSLLVRGAASTQAQIEAAERYVNSKTGAY